MNVVFRMRVAAVALAALAAACSSGTQTGSANARQAVASPVVQCGNHLRMGLTMTDPSQPVQTQVATFTQAVKPAPSWEVAAFRNIVTEFSSVVASSGKRAALQQPSFSYSALLRQCGQSASQ